MLLITKAQRVRLLRSGQHRDQDHAPVVKIFSPVGAATWLISEIDPREPDRLFGLCDLGLGFPELGYVSLTELQDVDVQVRIKVEDSDGRRPVTIGARLPLERDRYFKGKYPLSVYDRAAKYAGRIVTDHDVLEQASKQA